MSDTPRTVFVAHESGDAEWDRPLNRFGRMMAHAQILERELAAMTARCDEEETNKLRAIGLYDSCKKDLDAAIERAGKAERRACALDHPKGHHNTRDEIEMFLRDAYAAGCSAAQSRSLFTAMEYAKREAPRLRSLIDAARNEEGKHD